VCENDHKNYFLYGMKRSGFFQQMAFGALGVTVIPKQVLGSFIEPGLRFDPLYIGCYTSTPQEGIGHCLFDPVSGNIQSFDTCQDVENPSYIIFNNRRNVLYAVNETNHFNGENTGSVSAFHRDTTTGKLFFLNSVPSLGAHPCHLTIDRTGRFVLVANYTGGNVSVLPIQPDGRLGMPIDRIQHSGKGPVAGRQDSAHAHSVNLSPDNRFALVCDLGLDKITTYPFDSVSGKLISTDAPVYATAPGAGPRHLTFSRDGRYVIVINELNSTVSSLLFNRTSGELKEVCTCSTLPDDFTGDNTGADIHLSVNGQFVYASNRGHNSLAVYYLDPISGFLRILQHQSVLGKTPRNFTIHPSGKYLLVANQDSDSIQIFLMNPDNGKLGHIGESFQIHKPVCLLF